MVAIIGAGGNVGYSTSSALRKAGVFVRAIVHDKAKASHLSEIGCEIAVADLQDSASLAESIKGTDAVQAVLPLRPQTPDPVADIRRSGESIIEALKQARPKRVLLISDLGAHVRQDIGIPSIFRDFEAEFKELSGRKIILRSAEHMHNWGRFIPEAIASGTLKSFQNPLDMLQPTIFAPELGQISAKLLMQEDSAAEKIEVVQAEGPRRYSAMDVAATVSKLSDHTVTAVVVPRSDWGSAMSKMPQTLAALLTKTNDAKNKGGLIDIEQGAGEVLHGQTELIEGLRTLIPAK